MNAKSICWKYNSIVEPIKAICIRYNSLVGHIKTICWTSVIPLQNIWKSFAEFSYKLGAAVFFVLI